jgi:acyl-CoA synthetase (AMP-forming)/AMP-acid ligase II
LRTILGGAAPFYRTDVKRIIEAFPGRFTNGYGQGECPATITGMPKGMYASLEEAQLDSVGIARSGVEMKVVGEDGQALPPGELGEIIVRSPIVMQGYWNNEEATKSAIRNGWLYTGDVGTLDARGLLYLKDRSKDLIISGGSNIYPREVEDVLLLHPGVAEAAVIGEADPEWGEIVVACIVAKPGATVRREELDRLCLDNLARFKRPKQYVFLETMPRNVTGKILKTALREYVKVND